MLEYYLPRVSSYAGDIDFLFTTITLIVGFWFFLTMAVFLGFVYFFKRKDGVKAKYISGETHAEERWITIPHYLVIVCDIVLIAGTVVVWKHIKQDMPANTVPIKIVAQQWAWTFVHPGADGELNTADDITLVDELHVEKGVNYKFHLEATDVMHSFSVPVFRLKQDAVPGRVITGWFKPIKTGEYDIQCAEMCGIAHGLMGARLFVEEKEGHELWRKTVKPLPKSTNLASK
jgi:cytochrome c oxidase subunit 2